MYLDPSLANTIEVWDGHTMISVENNPKLCCYPKFILNNKSCIPSYQTSDIAVPFAGTEHILR